MSSFYVLGRFVARRLLDDDDLVLLDLPSIPPERLLPSFETPPPADDDDDGVMMMIVMAISEIETFFGLVNAASNNELGDNNLCDRIVLQ
mmetsp:Transcript_53142/g.129034  ORF Transcript_53142/g.129034 Transcript_53142/m.129034 type:complete len:90 (-) Transcript_53142:2433-2702(-)